MAFFPELQFNAPKINTPFENAGQFAQLQQAQNQNKLAQMQFQKAERDEADNNLLKETTRQYGNTPEYKNKLLEIGNIDAYQKQAKWENDQAKSGSDAEKAKIETTLKLFDAMGRIMSGVKDQASYENAVQQAAQLLGPDKVANLPREYNPELVQQKQAEALDAKTRLEERYKAMNFGLRVANQPFNPDGTPNSAFQNYAISKATAGATIRANTPQQPKLSPGERFTPDGNVEAIPGSSQYVKQSGLHSKDYQAKISIDTKTDQALKKIDAILDENNKGAFNSNFGGYNAYGTRLLPGATQDVGRKIESLKSDMKAAGLEIIRSGGSIGAMTEREWPIVQNMIDTIDPRMGEKAARDAFENIKTYLTKIKSNATEVYGTEWGGTQYAKKTNSNNTPPTGNIKAASSYLSGAKDKADFIARARALKAKGWTEEQIAAANGE